MKKISLFLGLFLSIVMVLLSFPVAVAAADEFTLTLLVDGNGITFPEPGVHSYVGDTIVEISAAPGDGWQFDHWTGEVQSPMQNSSVTMTADKVVTAYFVLIPPSGTLEGQVKDGQNNNPIQGARVLVYDQNEFMKGSILTDVLGEYSLEIPAGNYKVRFTKNGTYADRWYDDASDFASATVAVINEGAATVVDGSLYPLNTLTGSVRDFNTDSPIDEGISVRVYNSAGVNVASGDVAGGNFEIKLPPGSYRLNMFDISGYYQPEWYQDAASFEAASVIDFASYGETKPPIEIQLNPVAAGAFISGTVTDAATGVGIGGITVSIYDASEALVDSVSTISSGSYSSDALGTGSYAVKFNIGSGEYTTEWYDNAPGLDSATPVSVNAGETITVNAALEHFGPTGINGTVIDAQTHSPIQGIHVELMYNNSYWAGDAYTDASGHYVIANLAPGPYYRVKFSDNSLDNYIEEWNLDSPDWENAVDVAVVEKSLTTVNAELKPWGKIKGHVTDEQTGAGISGIEVMVLNNESLVGTPTTDASGYWEARRLNFENGDVFKLHFHDESGSYADEWFHNSNATNEAATVSLTNLAPVLTVDEQLSLPGTIEGVIEADQENSGEFLEGVPVYAFNLNYDYYKLATSDSNGYYRISGLLPGSYKIQFGTIQQIDGEWYHNQSSFENADEVLVTAGEITVVNEAMVLWGAIHGMATDSINGNPVLNLKVELYQDNTLLVTGGGNGFWGFAVQPGTYDLYFSDDYGNYEGKWLYGVTMTSHEQLEQNIVLVPFGKITGTVTDSNGEGIIDIQVTSYDGSGVAKGTARTDGYGNYQIGGLQPGEYRVFFNYESSPSIYVPEWYDNVYNSATATLVNVSSGSISSNVNALLESPPTVTGLTPYQGSQGETVMVTIIGTSLTHATDISFGPGSGITLTGGILVDSPIQISAEIIIAPDAVPGTRNLTVTTPAGSASLVDAFTVISGLRNTRTLLYSFLNVSEYGKPVVFVAMVLDDSPGKINKVPKGTVVFKDGAKTLGTGTLNFLGTATITSSSLSAGEHSITAEYSGDVNFSPSTSSPVIQRVKYNTSIKISSSKSPSTFGQSIQFTVVVNSTHGPSTGTVSFKDGNTTLDNVTLTNNKATFTTNALRSGVHIIRAVYSGDTTHDSSDSSLKQVVIKANTSVTLSTKPNPSTRGQSVTFTVTVRALSPGSGIPIGEVIFKDGKTVLGTAHLDASGQATFTTSALSRGTHSITSYYVGDDNFIESISPKNNQKVN